MVFESPFQPKTAYDSMTVGISLYLHMCIGKSSGATFLSLKYSEEVFGVLLGFFTSLFFSFFIQGENFMKQ